MCRGLLQYIFIIAKWIIYQKKNNRSNGYYDQSCRIDGQMFLIFVRICRISLFFLNYPPKILGRFTWRLQKEPLISNSKILSKRKKVHFTFLTNQICLLKPLKSQNQFISPNYFNWSNLPPSRFLFFIFLRTSEILTSNFAMYDALCQKNTL